MQSNLNMIKNETTNIFLAAKTQSIINYISWTNVSTNLGRENGILSSPNEFSHNLNLTNLYIICVGQITQNAQQPTRLCHFKHTNTCLYITATINSC